MFVIPKMLFKQLLNHHYFRKKNNQKQFLVLQLENNFLKTRLEKYDQIDLVFGLSLAFTNSSI